MIKTKLRSGNCTVVFTKSDGTERKMLCTLQESTIPAAEPKKTDRIKKENDNALAVWDLEANGWRSFRFDSVTQFI